MRNFMLVMLAVTLGACGDDKDSTVDWDPECEGTLDTHTCITLAVRSNPYVRANAPGDVIGTISWALYEDGDVDLIAGPLADPIYSGHADDVDLSTEELEHLIHVTNVEVRKYHALAQLDDDLSGGPNDGDPVTTPQAAFDTEAGEHITRSVVIDFLCSGGQCDQP